MSIAPVVTISNKLAAVRAQLACALLPAVAAILLLAAPAAAQGGAGKSAPSVVGSVDIAKVIDQYPIYIKLRAELNQQVDAFLARQKETTNSMRELLATIQVQQKTDPERKGREFQLNIMRQTQEFEQKSFEEQFAVAELRMMLRVYEDLDFAIHQVAQRRGVDLVMPKRDILIDPKPIAEQPPGVVEQRVNAYQRRTVWYSSRTVDLTGDLIKYMMTPLPERGAKARAFLMQKPAPASATAPKGNAGSGASGAGSSRTGG